MDESKLLSGKIVSEYINETTIKDIEFLKSKNVNPGLVVVLVGDDPASAIYVRSKGRMCEKMGIVSETITLPARTSENDLLDLINKLNNDNRFNGILVQLPLPKQINERRVIDAINPEKDVDCFHPKNVGLLMIGNPYLTPCTPAGIIEILKYYKIDPSGKDVVVIGRSNIVGKPIANIMLQKKEYANSVVTVCHSAAPDVSYYTKQADILIAAMGSPKFVKGDMVKEGVVVIDVGINRVEDQSTSKGYRIVGDVDFDEVSKKASYITPVPGGVGPMTIAMLLKNTFEAFIKYGD